MRAEPPPKTPVEAAEEEDVLSLGELLRILWRRLWVIALVSIVLTAAAVGYSLGQTPIYEASIKILVGQEQRADTPSQLGSDVMGLQQLTQTVADLIATRPVAEAAIERLGLQMSPEDFLENLSVQQVANTQTIEVSYKDSDPERAQRIANTVGEVFSDQVSEVSPSANAITATLWERAAVPDEPVSPKPVRNGLLALLLGLMLGAGLAFLLEYLDDTWRSPEELEQVSGRPNFGAIPEFKVVKGKKGAG
jgi:capsular polysaccharide biosynthesis protein